MAREAFPHGTPSLIFGDKHRAASPDQSVPSAGRWFCDDKGSQDMYMNKTRLSGSS